VWVGEWVGVVVEGLWVGEVWNMHRPCSLIHITSSTTMWAHGWFIHRHILLACCRKSMLSGSWLLASSNCMDAGMLGLGMLPPC
jgi:hypothetical protein